MILLGMDIIVLGSRMDIIDLGIISMDIIKMDMVEMGTIKMVFIIRNWTLEWILKEKD